MPLRTKTMRTKHTRRQTQADTVDTALNMDRNQLPDFLNVNCGYKVHVKYEHGGVGCKIVPPMTENQMFQHMRDEYPEAFVYRVEYLR
jgi:hypothetical protein